MGFRRTGLPEGAPVLPEEVDAVTADATIAFLRELKRTKASPEAVIKALTHGFPTANWDEILDAYHLKHVDDIRRRNNTF